MNDAAFPVPVSDVAQIRALLIAAAQERRAMSYSEILLALGHRFTRPKMRAMCKTLDAIDARAAADGEPELAVLVVRESDRLPGQGWWVGLAQSPHDYAGPWDGPEAQAFVRRLHDIAFDYWATHGFDRRNRKASPPVLPYPKSQEGCEP